MEENLVKLNLVLWLRPDVPSGIIEALDEASITGKFPVMAMLRGALARHEIDELERMIGICHADKHPKS